MLLRPSYLELMAKLNECNEGENKIDFFDCLELFHYMKCIIALSFHITLLFQMDY